MSGQPDGVILTITLFKNYFCLRYANTKKAVNTEHAHEKKGIRAKYYDIEKRKRKRKRKRSTVCTRVRGPVLSIWVS